jgi:hypothetical protein
VTDDPNQRGKARRGATRLFTINVTAARVWRPHNESDAVLHRHEVQVGGRRVDQPVSDTAAGPPLLQSHRRGALKLAALALVTVVVIVTAGCQPSQRSSPSPASSSVSPSPVVMPSQVELPFRGLMHPTAVAVDGAGNVYVANSSLRRVLTLAAGSNAPAELPFTGPNGVPSTGSPYAVSDSSDGELRCSASVLPFSSRPWPSLSPL